MCEKQRFSTRSVCPSNVHSPHLAYRSAYSTQTSIDSRFGSYPKPPILPLVKSYELVSYLSGSMGNLHTDLALDIPKYI